MSLYRPTQYTTAHHPTRAIPHHTRKRKHGCEANMHASTRYALVVHLLIHKSAFHAHVVIAWHLREQGVATFSLLVVAHPVVPVQLWPFLLQLTLEKLARYEPAKAWEKVGALQPVRVTHVDVEAIVVPGADDPQGGVHFLRNKSKGQNGRLSV